MIRLLLLFTLLGTILLARSQPHQGHHSIQLAPRGIFNFDPSTGRFIRNSLSPVDQYIRAWRATGSSVGAIISDSLLSRSYRLYLSLVDSTLWGRALNFLGAYQSEFTIQHQDSSIYGFDQSRIFENYFKSDIERIRRFFATPILTLDSALHFDPYAPSRFSNLFHIFQLHTTGADLSLFAPSKATDSLPFEIFPSTILDLFRYDNRLVVVKLRGSELMRILENSVSKRFYRATNMRDDVINSRSPYYSTPTLAGVEYQINITRQRGRMIDHSAVKGDSIYRVAMNSWQAKTLNLKVDSDYGDYNLLLISNFPTTYEQPERWSVIPEKWVEKAKNFGR